MITELDFVDVVDALYELLPFSKRISTQAIALAWSSFPEPAKHQLNRAMLDYAAGQLLLDPAPDKEKPPHLALLRYVYRMGDGVPRFDWGLKADLPQRMASPGVFHNDPTSLADMVATGDAPALDGRRSEPQGVLAKLSGGAL